MGWTHDVTEFVYNHPVQVGVFSVLFIIWGMMVSKNPKDRDKEDA